MTEAPVTDADAKARATAHGLMQDYIGPDHKVLDVKAFCSALVQALRKRCEQRRFSPTGP